MDGRKKVLLYIDSMQRGGAQRVMSVLSGCLCSKGVETVLVNDIVPVDGIAEYSIDSKIKRLFLDEGIKQGKKSNLARIKKLRKIVKNEEPDVILSFLGPPNIRMLVATAGLPCKKYVSVRNDPYKEYGGGIKRLIAGLLFHLSNGCVFQTEMAAQYFPLRVQKKSRVILNPVDETFFSEKWEGSENSIICVGRLYPQKNHELLLRAFQYIHQAIPSIKLKICGKGTEELKLRNLAENLGVANSVDFLGEISNVKREIVKSKCFVLSSNYEGLPNALMEAMAVGAPVVSTDCPCGGPRMLITNRINGVLVPCGDEHALANAVLEILSNEKIRRDYSEAAREYAQEFETGKVMKEWLDFLKLESE